MNEEHTRRIEPNLVMDALRAHRNAVWISLAVVPVLAVASGFFLRPKLKAEVELLVEEQTEKNPILEDMAVESPITNRLPAINSIVKSTRTLTRVLEDLGEISDDTPRSEAIAAVEDFRGQVDVYGEGGGLVKITVVGRDPHRVYDGADLLTEVLIEEMVRPQNQSLDETVKFLEAQLERVQKELRDVEEGIRTFKEEHADVLPDVHKLNLESYARLSKALLDAESELIANEERQRVYEEELARYDPHTSRVAKRLAHARARLRVLQSKYTNEHPEVKVAAADVADVRARLRKVEADSRDSEEKRIERLAKVAGRVEEDDEGFSYTAVASRTEALREKVDFLKTRVAEARGKLEQFAASEQRLSALMRQHDAKSAVYSNLLTRYEDARVARALVGYEASNKIRVIEEPTPPAEPPRFSIPFLVLVGLLGGGVLGLSLVFVFELIDPTIRNSGEAEALTGAPVIGIVDSVA
ncbi:MAG: GumC family protein [Myxococcota bacterium]